MSEWGVPDRFAVAFSLAGEQRQLVLPVAQEVRDILGPSSVFYDDWYLHWIAGQDSDLLLQRVYSERAELVVMCVSADYGGKSWTRTEHRAARDRLMQASTEQQRHCVLPLRVGDGAVEGIRFTDIVPDIRGMNPAQVAELIVNRLKLVRSYSAAVPAGLPQWPSGVPALDWPMANHGEARAAFARLLCEESPERALLVRGASETGKSHMSKQMLRNGRRLPGVVSGRFDFKGTANIGIEIEAFAGPLNLEPPGAGSVSERLARIFTELRGRARPTLLIFDTYEAAGEAKDWIERVLLPHLASAHWLRVVVVGQSVPSRAGSVWEEVAGSTLTLQLPSPEDWLTYGRANRGDSIDLKFVAQVHQLIEGRASVLATLLGPVS